MTSLGNRTTQATHSLSDDLYVVGLTTSPWTDELFFLEYQIEDELREHPDMPVKDAFLLVLRMLREEGVVRRTDALRHLPRNRKCDQLYNTLEMIANQFLAGESGLKFTKIDPKGQQKEDAVPDIPILPLFGNTTYGSPPRKGVYFHIESVLGGGSYES